MRTLDTTFKVEENSRTFQATIEFKDFSMTPPKIQAHFETMNPGIGKEKRKGTACEVLKPIQPVSFQPLPKPSATS